MDIIVDPGCVPLLLDAVGSVITNIEACRHEGHTDGMVRVEMEVRDIAKFNDPEPTDRAAGVEAKLPFVTSQLMTVEEQRTFIASSTMLMQNSIHYFTAKENILKLAAKVGDRIIAEGIIEKHKETNKDG